MTSIAEQRVYRLSHTGYETFDQSQWLQHTPRQKKLSKAPEAPVASMPDHDLQVFSRATGGVKSTSRQVTPKSFPRCHSHRPKISPMLPIGREGVGASYRWY
jgi:hypothetical protein